MWTIEKRVVTEEVIKRSRFIGFLMPCPSEQVAQEHRQQLCQQYPDASHIVFAYRIKTVKGIEIQIDDAGEPKGTAGKPVYQHLEGKNLINIICIVVRYFGGIKLGVGGLTRAYSHAAKRAIEKAKIVEYIEYAEIKLNLEYHQMQHFNYQLEKISGQIIAQDFSDSVNILIRIPEANIAQLNQLTALIKRH